MVVKTTVKVFNLVFIYWWIAYCIIGLGIPTVVDSKYLPTRRSDPSIDGLDRLREILSDILENDTPPASSVSSIPRKYAPRESFVKNDVISNAYIEPEALTKHDKLIDSNDDTGHISMRTSKIAHKYPEGRFKSDSINDDVYKELYRQGLIPMNEQNADENDDNSVFSRAYRSYRKANPFVNNNGNNRKLAWISPHSYADFDNSNNRNMNHYRLKKLFNDDANNNNNNNNNEYDLLNEENENNFSPRYRHLLKRNNLPLRHSFV